MKRLLATVLLVLAAASPAAAACPKTTLGDVEDEVMCPVCGTPLGLATEAPQAQRQRELIRRLVDDCRSKDEVKAALRREYGDAVLAVPEGEGFDLAAYLVPGLAILLAGCTVGLTALRWKRARAEDEHAESDPSAQGGPPAATSERLQTDLERYDL